MYMLGAMCICLVLLFDAYYIYTHTLCYLFWYTLNVIAYSMLFSSTALYT